MSEALPTFDQMTFEGFGSAISSPGSGDGPTRSGSPAGLTTGPSGPAPAPASRSARRGSGKGSTIPGTSGPSSVGSSASIALTESLASRLAARLPGSTLYAETWKEKATPSGRRLWAHTASAPRTSGNGCIGWPTPCTQDGPKGGPSQGVDRLPAAASLSGWPTPNAGPQNDGDTTWEQRREELKAKHGNGNGFGLTLGQASQLSGWATPTSRDFRSDEASQEFRERQWRHPRRKALNAQALHLASGPTPSGSPAATGKPGQLNPAFSLWLMGYCVEWVLCGLRVNAKSRKR